MNHFRYILSTLLIFSVVTSVAKESHPLYFAYGDFAHERHVPVGVLTKVKLNGKFCAVQVDTGMGNSFQWHDYSDQPKTFTVKVELGSLKVSYPASAEAMKLVAGCRSDAPIASLGNAFFEGNSVEFNFSSRKLIINSSPLLKSAPAARDFRYAKWGREGGHILIQVGESSELPAEALLDTGSLRVELGLLEPKEWDRLSAPSKTLTTSFPIHAWGVDHQCTSTVATMPFSFGGEEPRIPIVTFCPTLQFKPPEPILGVVGMRRFLTSRLIIDYQSKRWVVLKANQR